MEWAAWGNSELPVNRDSQVRVTDKADHQEGTSVPGAGPSMEGQVSVCKALVKRRVTLRAMPSRVLSGTVGKLAALTAMGHFTDHHHRLGSSGPEMK